jgi:hypothetical protein
MTHSLGLCKRCLRIDWGGSVTIPCHTKDDKIVPTATLCSTPTTKSVNVGPEGFLNLKQA